MDEQRKDTVETMEEAAARLLRRLDERAKKSGHVPVQICGPDSASCSGLSDEGRDGWLNGVQPSRFNCRQPGGDGEAEGQ